MTVLVTGATGSVGRLVVDELLQRGAQVRALTIDPGRAQLPPEVEVVVGSVLRPDTLPPALDGIDRVYLAPAPQTVDEVAAMMAKAGVEYVVDLSGEPDSWWASVASAVERSGVTWTHLSPGEFMENAESWVSAQLRATGEVRDAAPGASNAPIAMQDVAAVAARVLTEDGHGGRTYPMTGPETLSRAELVRQIGTALGRPVPCIAISADEMVEILQPAMGEYARWYVDGAVQMGEHAQAPTTAVADILGRPATAFAQWAAANIGLFR